MARSAKKGFAPGFVIGFQLGALRKTGGGRSRPGGETTDCVISVDEVSLAVILVVLAMICEFVELEFRPEGYRGVTRGTRFGGAGSRIGTPGGIMP